MSTYYYLVCDEHKISSEIVCGRSFPDRWWADDPESLVLFAADHADCKPRLVSEHSDLQHEYGRPYERDED